MAEAVSREDDTVGYKAGKLIPRCPSATRCTKSTVSSRTTTLLVRLRLVTARKLLENRSSPLVVTRESPMKPHVQQLTSSYDVSKSCTLEELSTSLCYSVT